MSERLAAPSPEEREPYWQADLALGEVLLHGERVPARLRLHHARERYYGSRAELIRLAQPHGERLYLHGKPYVAEPELQLTIDLATQRERENGQQPALGTVLASEWVGQRTREIGQAQGWCYSADRTIVLWEAFLFDWLRAEHPLEDEALALLWGGFERALVQQLPDAQRIVTPAWEDLYPREHWRQFLTTQGYRPCEDDPQRVFAKLL